MAGRDPRESRILGLWTASWLAVMLVAGLLWIGDLSVQWPVLLVPLLWALIALRPRRGAGRPGRRGRAAGPGLPTHTARRAAAGRRPGARTRHRRATGRVGPGARGVPARLIALGECARFCRGGRRSCR